MTATAKETYFIEVYLDSSEKFGDENLNSGVYLFIQKNKINNEELVWKKNELVAHLNNSVKDHILRKYMVLKYRICLIKDKEIHILMSNLEKKYEVNEIGDSLETNVLEDINSLKKYKPYGHVISNRSSGLQGGAIANELAENGAEVTFITGPVDLDPPHGSNIIRVETADEMYDAVHSSLPADAAVFTAAVADWKIKKTEQQKLKKQTGNLPAFDLTENKDILASVAKLKKNRPKIVMGFAAETENILENSKSKLMNKGCDFIVANDVSLGTQTMGGSENTAIILSKNNVETLPKMSKRALAKILVEKISRSFEEMDA